MHGNGGFHVWMFTYAYKMLHVDYWDLVSSKSVFKAYRGVEYPTWPAFEFNVLKNISCHDHTGQSLELAHNEHVKRSHSTQIGTCCI